ncbi:polysaccharide deacetylase [Nostoc sp. NIES-3756]|uniref:polysaccharide deacetylase family protein n=1 Tax=Nostoc sp. NIES-3756 TaxID=1751286 RepID=UPI000721C7E3|nr:polysaccharide deacetylase family protein [Nostoc sp. NIES-3756]BAT53815.1 polysaccharide deacetylase [Nostoc sp. NIES-3756]
MPNEKLHLIVKLVSVVGITAGGISLGLLIPKIGFDYSWLSKQSINRDDKAINHAISSTSAQAAAPVIKTEIPKAFQGQTIYQAKLKPNNKVVALTFDDGPGPKNTAQILEILKKNNIKATFFMVGIMVKNFPQVAKQVAADGHVIGNHTWHHRYRRMDVATAASEINRTADIIYKTTGVKTTLFRPPGGFLKNGLVDYAKSQKYAVMMWSDESSDTQRREQPPALIKNVIKGVKPGAIVLMHDGGGNRSRTVQALPQIISDLKAQGYKFVTIPELLEMQSKEESLATASPITASPQAKNQSNHK